VTSALLSTDLSFCLLRSIKTNSKHKNGEGISLDWSVFCVLFKKF
ncbi:hypothetical protein chiPu_0028801, partial [Chiloscyllium punctatum]|nr:hypothetical protein [Chiloscyllium punctatum]